MDSHYHDVLADYDTTDLGGGDGVAEPFYSLLGEVFDMRGVFKIGKKYHYAFITSVYELINILHRSGVTIICLTNLHA